MAEYEPVDEFVTVGEFANLAGVDPSQVRRWHVERRIRIGTIAGIAVVHVNQLDRVPKPSVTEPTV